MNKKIKAEWVRRLRSGEYPQGHGYLQLAGNFCCLGVLAEIAYEASIATKSISNVTECTNYIDVDGDGSQTSLTFGMRKWAAVEADPDIDYNGVRTTLIGCNDHYGLTFDQIADLIEEQL